MHINYRLQHKMIDLMVKNTWVSERWLHPQYLSLDQKYFNSFNVNFNCADPLLYSMQRFGCDMYICANITQINMAYLYLDLHVDVPNV